VTEVPDQPFLRFFCHVVQEDTPFGDLSFAYFTELRKTGIPIRVLACNPGAFLTGGRWDEFNEEFLRSVPKRFINVVCGDNGELVRLFTVDTTNIAITASYNGEPTSNEITALQRFDVVICPSPDEAHAYQELGIPAQCLRPDPAALADLLRSFV
jgi:hypothetical protein